ncbi:hypothetical protein FDP41_004182 [Naegleria fowleri]|uniref:Uncharacterized protein n=1 Tax=Naegleria fowleri TaxID=5763 RepID=A0A6A5BIU4_NAEFO|nr:uncharacterized protein FDP41_004182 [Naegleria fowleri]KAF0976887.1 hypothetical protein FDP41_004182 [Naegleria fowleri]CAG4712187.1 unnamed protein product [Naegleria fowleri]
MNTNPSSFSKGMSWLTGSSQPQSQQQPPNIQTSTLSSSMFQSMTSGNNNSLENARLTSPTRHNLNSLMTLSTSPSSASSNKTGNSLTDQTLGSDLVNTGSNNISFGEDFDEVRSTISNESTSSRFSSSSARNRDLQKLLMNTNGTANNSSSSNRYADVTQSASIDSTTLSWDEVQNVMKVGSVEKEMEQMKEKIDHLQRNNLTLSQSLYSTNKEHILLLNTLKEKIHEVFPNILIENQKLKEQVKELTSHVFNLEKQLEKVKVEHENTRITLEHKIEELKREMDSLKTKKVQTKYERIEELINACIKPIEHTLKNNNIAVKRCSDDIYQLGQFKLNVNLEKRGENEIVVVHLSDKTIPFEDFLRTFCSKFIMK